MVGMNLTEQEQIILDYILFNRNGIDEYTLYFDLELYFNIRDAYKISSDVISLKFKNLITVERIYLQTGKSFVVYKGIK